MKKLPYEKVFPLVLALGIYSSKILAVLPIVYDPYDVFQNTITARNSVTALMNQAKQLQFDVENLKKLSKGHFENSNAVLSQLTDIASQGKSLSYGLKNIDMTFGTRFPGLRQTTDFNQDYSNWSGTAYDTLKNGMLSMSLQGKLFDKENESIRELQTLSESTQGNLSAQQTSHRIALQEVGQLQKLRQLLLTQGSAQNIFMTYQLQTQQSQQAAMHEWIKNSQISFHKYQGNSGFGVNETPTIP